MFLGLSTGEVITPEKSKFIAEFLRTSVSEATHEHFKAIMIESYNVEITEDETLGVIQELVKELETLQDAKEILND